MSTRKARRAARLHTRVLAWVERHLIADDPNPEYSDLDRMAGLGKPRPAGE